MAPEYFPFVGFIVLGGFALMALAAGAVLLFMARRNREHRRALRISSMVAFSATVILVLMLLALGSMIRQQFFLNEPLVAACGEGDLREVRRLLSKGASPDAYGVDFMQTALIAASKSGHAEIVALLLGRGASVHLEDSKGKTALQWAKALGHSDVARLLEEAEARMRPGGRVGRPESSTGVELGR